MKPTPIQTQAPEKRSQCLWMQAGIAHRKFCEMGYHCTECRYDKAMQRIAEENRKIRKSGRVPAGKRGKIVFWKDRLNALPISKRPCVHYMKGRIEHRLCNQEYKCGTCEFDQFFYDEYSVHAVVRPVDVLDIKSFKVPQGYYFHKGHTWAKIEDNAFVRVGIDEFALRLMGPPDRIGAPLMGKEVSQGEPDIFMSRGGKEARVLSPVSGVVTSINPKLRERGNLAHQDPFTEGWVMQIHSKTLREDLKNLMISSETTAFFEEEVDRLYDLIEETAGPLAADGGSLGNDIYGNMPELGWDRLTDAFLKNK